MAENKNTKGVNISVMHILKGIVDSRVPKINARIYAAASAENELPGVQSAVGYAQRALDNARIYDPSDVRECREELSEYQTKLGELQKTIADGESAATELRDVSNFNITYRQALYDYAIGPERVAAWRKRIAELNALYDKLLEKYERIDDRMDGCSINMSTRAPGSGVYEQACADFDHLVAASAETYKSMQEVKKQIRQLETQMVAQR